MATISFNFPDDKIDAIIDAWCIANSYPETIWENDVLVPNPETKLQFTRRSLKQMMKNAYVSEKAKVAMLAASEAADAEV
jgi:hypothetical protein